MEHWDEPVERPATAQQLGQSQQAGGRRHVSSPAPAPGPGSASRQAGAEERRGWREEQRGDAARGLPEDPGVRPAVSELEQQLSDVASGHHGSETQEVSASLSSGRSCDASSSPSHRGSSGSRGKPAGQLQQQHGHRRHDQLNEPSERGEQVPPPDAVVGAGGDSDDNLRCHNDDSYQAYCHKIRQRMHFIIFC